MILKREQKIKLLSKQKRIMKSGAVTFFDRKNTGKNLSEKIGKKNEVRFKVPKYPTKSKKIHHNFLHVSCETFSFSTRSE